jgi:hypothetical protein
MSAGPVTSFATSPARRIFSTWSASIKLRSLLSPWRSIVVADSMQLLFHDVGVGQFAGAQGPGKTRRSPVCYTPIEGLRIIRKGRPKRCNDSLIPKASRFHRRHPPDGEYSHN